MNTHRYSWIDVFYLCGGGTKVWRCNDKIVDGYLHGLFQKSDVEKEEQKASGGCEWALVGMSNYMCTDARRGAAQEEELKEFLTKLETGSLSFDTVIQFPSALSEYVPSGSIYMRCKLNWQQNAAVSSEGN